MRHVTIWKLEYMDNDGNYQSFHPSRRQAKAAFDRVKGSTLKPRSESITPLTVAPTKRGILVLLKYHSPERDNG